MPEQFKKQHFVPQAYLKRFACKTTNGTYTIGVCLFPQNENKKLFRAPIDKVGYENNIYDIEETSPKGDTKYWEHTLANEIDTYYGSFLDSLLASVTLTTDGKKVINEEQRKILAKMMLVQMSRVPTFIGHMSTRLYKAEDSCKGKILQHYKSAKNLRGKVVPKKSIKRVKKFKLTEKEHFDSLFSFIFSRLEPYCQYLCQRTWIFLYNSRANTFPFCTSDNPVIVVNVHTKKAGLGINGIADQATYIVYPLSPTIAIALLPKSLGLEDMDCLRHNVENDQDITRINWLECAQTIRHLFLPPVLFKELEKSKEQS